MDKEHVSDTWKKRLEAAEGYLSGSIAVGQQTIIMDEPESFLSIPMQVAFWRRILGEDPKRFERLQLIVATHSPFAFRLSHANYIEMNPGYLRECKEALKFAGNTHNEVIA